MVLKVLGGVIGAVLALAIYAGVTSRWVGRLFGSSIDDYAATPVTLQLDDTKACDRLATTPPDAKLGKLRVQRGPAGCQVDVALFCKRDAARDALYFDWLQLPQAERADLAAAFDEGCKPGVWLSNREILRGNDAAYEQLEAQQPTDSGMCTCFTHSAWRHGPFIGATQARTGHCEYSGPFGTPPVYCEHSGQQTLGTIGAVGAALGTVIGGRFRRRRR